MSSTKIEFAVQMTCEGCVKTVRQSLDGVPGVEKVKVDLGSNTVIVESSLPAEDILNRLRSTGMKSVVKGAGTLAGVAIMDFGSRNVHGVVRFVQQDNECLVDGTIDGLIPGKHQLSVHECGDVSQGCESVGDFYNPHRGAGLADSKRIYGDLGDVAVESDGRAAFRFDDSVINLSEIIGRALVISDERGRLACGIIARSAGLFQNPKTICACDGVSIWNEKIPPKL